jgi:hypothetical protein
MFGSVGGLPFGLCNGRVANSPVGGIPACLMSRKIGFCLSPSFIGFGTITEHLAECPNRMSRYIFAARQLKGRTRVADSLRKRALQNSDRRGK